VPLFAFQVDRPFSLAKSLVRIHHEFGFKETFADRLHQVALYSIRASVRKVHFTIYNQSILWRLLSQNQIVRRYKKKFQTITRAVARRATLRV
jgi:hypothetical protein